MEVKAIFQQLLAHIEATRATDIQIRTHGTATQLIFEYPTAVPAEQTWTQPLSVADGAKLIRFLKYEAELDLAETRRPQSGLLQPWDDPTKLVLRLAVIGDYRGNEAVTIRCLHPVTDQKLQFRDWQPVVAFQQAVQTGAGGLYVIAGAMGSGKTTTLAHIVGTALADRQVLSIEDPVEIVQPAVLQLQVNPKLGLTFDRLARVALRHHPEVMVIGEIRDPITANVAIEAALSGHIVLATLHARSVAGVVPRLVALGADAQQAAAVLMGVCYQRRQADGQIALVYAQGGPDAQTSTMVP